MTFYSVGRVQGSRIARPLLRQVLREQLTWYVLLRGDFQGDITSQVQTGGCDPANPECDEDFFFTDENGWGAFTAGVNLGFETLGQVITQPTIGIFPSSRPIRRARRCGARSTPTRRTAPTSATRTSASTISTCRYIDTSTWDQATCGYYWYDDCQTRIGYMIDKIAALDELSQSQAYFTGRDTTADVRQYAIGYIVPYKKQIEEKFGAIFAGNTDDYAPYFRACSTVEANNGVCAAPGTLIPVLPSWTSPNPSAAPTAQRIDPSTGFTVQLYAGVYGLSSLYDHVRPGVHRHHEGVRRRQRRGHHARHHHPLGGHLRRDAARVDGGHQDLVPLHRSDKREDLRRAMATPTANIQYLDSLPRRRRRPPRRLHHDHRAAAQRPGRPHAESA